MKKLLALAIILMFILSACTVLHNATALSGTNGTTFYVGKWGAPLRVRGGFALEMFEFLDDGTMLYTSSILETGSSTLYSGTYTINGNNIEVLLNKIDSSGVDSPAEPGDIQSISPAISLNITVKHVDADAFVIVLPTDMSSFFANTTGIPIVFHQGDNLDVAIAALYEFSRVPPTASEILSGESVVQNANFYYGTWGAPTRISPNIVVDLFEFLPNGTFFYTTILWNRASETTYEGTYTQKEDKLSCLINCISSYIVEGRQESIPTFTPTMFTLTVEKNEIGSIILTLPRNQPLEFANEHNTPIMFVSHSKLYDAISAVYKEATVA